MNAIKIVIADNESIIRMDLRELLEESGHEIIGEAVDGLQSPLDGGPWIILDNSEVTQYNPFPRLDGGQDDDGIITTVTPPGGSWFSGEFYDLPEVVELFKLGGGVVGPLSDDERTSPPGVVNRSGKLVEIDELASPLIADSKRGCLGDCLAHFGLLPARFTGRL